MNHVIFNNNLTVTVSTLGAELVSVKHKDAEYLWSGDPKYWKNQAPVMFPYTGRLTDGKYSYGGKTYPMDIHGFARGREFDIESMNESFITLSLSGEETKEIYPFSFLLKISYRLIENQIEISYQVENKSADGSPMYFGIGGHPGFNVPLEPELDFTDYYLEFSHSHIPTRIGFSPTLFINGTDRDFPLKNGRLLPLAHSLFDDDAIFLKNTSRQVTLKSDKGFRSLTVTYPQMAYLGLWHKPKTEAPYLCIEPWTSLPSRMDIVEDLQFKSDLIVLKSGKIYDNIWYIAVN